ncbi:MAG: hypothetical protein KDJ15_01770 [Alphaproteobacteria bacterium]|nr:hypothetical protein [Alphaproteobacteria bacterium]
MIRQIALYSLLCLAVSIPLSGCGVKPTSLDPPPGSAGGEDFPHTYPAPPGY